MHYCVRIKREELIHYACFKVKMDPAFFTDALTFVLGPAEASLAMMAVVAAAAVRTPLALLLVCVCPIFDQGPKAQVATSS